MVWSMVQGASRGLGLSLVRQLLERGDQVVATCRDPEQANDLRRLSVLHGHRLVRVALDTTSESSIKAARDQVAKVTERLDLLMNVAGLLHEEGMMPERRLQEVRLSSLQKSFSVNAFGPLLVIEHFHDLMIHGDRAVIANLSARVGSIDDNRLGGWYAYRGSKAAQNMFTKNVSIELGRRGPGLIVVALHPGTVDTDLSKPFQRSVKPGKLFTTERAAEQLLGVVDGLTREDNGRFIAWDGSGIAW